MFFENTSATNHFNRGGRVKCKERLRAFERKEIAGQSSTRYCIVAAADQRMDDIPKEPRRAYWNALWCILHVHVQFISVVRLLFTELSSRQIESRRKILVLERTLEVKVSFTTIS